jgi:hypothetical protein
MTAVIVSVLVCAETAHAEAQTRVRRIELHRASSAEEVFIRKNFFDEDIRYWFNQRQEFGYEIEPPMHIASAFVDGSGSKAFFVVIEITEFCGSIGCNMFIWQKKKRRWQKIGEDTQAAITILPHKTSGYHDLGIRKRVLTWSGTRYVSGPVPPFTGTLEECSADPECPLKDQKFMHGRRH